MAGGGQKTRLKLSEHLLRKVESTTASVMGTLLQSCCSIWLKFASNGPTSSASDVLSVYISRSCCSIAPSGCEEVCAKGIQPSSVSEVQMMRARETVVGDAVRRSSTVCVTSPSFERRKIWKLSE